MTNNKILYKWEDIQGDFTDCLLIGNGASIAISSNKFKYTHLFQEAKSQEIISDESQKVFQEFGTQDFEYVLAIVATASRVNKALSIQDEKTNATYENIRNGLIEVVQSIHSDHADIVDKLEKGGNFASHFKSVISLNYDLIFPWIRMLANAKNPKVAFKDGFSTGGYFPDDWEKVKEPMRSRGESSVIMCYYPHGNLSLVTLMTNEGNCEVKIKANKDNRENLLDTIVSKWKEGHYVPLFVSEGSSPQKLGSIRRSDYLSEIYYRALPRVGKTLVVYGSSFQQNDTHIFQAILQGKIEKVAVSIHKPSTPDLDMKYREIAHMLKNIKHVEIIFFDAESAGAWIY